MPTRCTPKRDRPIPGPRAQSPLCLHRQDQPLTLFKQVKELPWAQAPLLFTKTSRAHGREERRTVKVLSAPGVAFAHAKQVLRVTGGSKSALRERCGAPTPTCSPTLLLSRPTPTASGSGAGPLADRGAAHHVRDLSFGEDASRVRSGHGAQNMAMLRNLAIPLLARLEWSSVPAAVRWVPYEALTRPLDLIGLA